MKMDEKQRRIVGKLKRIKPRFGVLPTRVQDNPKTTYKRHPKHRNRDA